MNYTVYTSRRRLSTSIVICVGLVLLLAGCGGETGTDNGGDVTVAQDKAKASTAVERSRLFLGCERIAGTNTDVLVGKFQTDNPFWYLITRPPNVFQELGFATTEEFREIIDGPGDYKVSIIDADRQRVLFRSTYTVPESCTSELGEASDSDPITVECASFGGTFKDGGWQWTGSGSCTSATGMSTWAARQVYHRSMATCTSPASALSNESTMVIVDEWAKERSVDFDDSDKLPQYVYGVANICTKNYLVKDVRNAEAGGDIQVASCGPREQGIDDFVDYELQNCNEVLPGSFCFQENAESPAYCKRPDGEKAEVIEQCPPELQDLAWWDVGESVDNFYAEAMFFVDPETYRAWTEALAQEKRWTDYNLPAGESITTLPSIHRRVGDALLVGVTYPFVSLIPYPVVPKVITIREETDITVSSSVASERLAAAKTKINESLKTLNQKVNTPEVLDLTILENVLGDEIFCEMDPLEAKDRLSAAFEDSLDKFVPGKDFQDKWRASTDNEKSQLRKIIRNSVIEKYYTYDHLRRCCD